ncbi:MAG TPA: helix-turn-helix transcriptional regulator [Streptosporangiaceae bacterium]|jgi:DNA-binding CsgD family transcriptional regulator
MSLPKTAMAARKDIVRLAHTGLDSVALRRAVAGRLRRVVPAESYGFATLDPATMLLTGSVRENIPDPTVALLARNEYAEADYNKVTDLARRAVPVARLAAATRGELNRSRRYRDILAPEGWRDEIRALFATGGHGWGFICMHRERTSPDFTAVEARFLAALTSHIATGLRKSLLIGLAAADTDDDLGPGVLEVTGQLELIKLNSAARHWLADAGGGDPATQGGLPHAVHAVVAQLRAVESNPLSAAAPRLRVRGRSGRWLTVHASRLQGGGQEGSIAVIVEPSSPAEVAILIGHGHGLSSREAEVCRLTARGLSTEEMARALSISANTVQDHLKSIFSKTGARNRRELVSRIFMDEYAPRLGRPLDAQGWFASTGRRGDSA